LDPTVDDHAQPNHHASMTLAARVAPSS